ncbi:MAG TPA: RNA-binding cell elongation regulator Jag/EloR [Spirochaetales bacterium]|nr:RNA-binding cell elongation regulator Jag/EloR [Spirochaetales bacterium]HPG86686.1 RNA-binding cell elongation regulator Jag/EloR [Spirochaetales bacterium]HPM73555.1 RNA-binding cell elongation regulator Jag/EloR [Spirochaetales bacterium]
MEYEFEGRTEEEAIEIAARELGIARDEFDVEIMESQRGGFLKKGKTRIRVQVRGAPAAPAPRKRPAERPDARNQASVRGDADAAPRTVANVEVDGAFERKLLDFVQTTVEKMGYTCKASILFREELKLGIRLDSDSAAILIGKKGKNLDALQLLANVYAGRLGREDLRVILDSENYRIRREEAIVKMAYEVAERVRSTRNSVLLEPMNPFERRIVHTTLNDIVDIETKSEGDGLYKQVRVMFRGRR